MSESSEINEEEQMEFDFYSTTFTNLLRSEMAAMVRAIDSACDEDDDAKTKYACLRGCRIFCSDKGYVVTYTSAEGKPFKKLQKVILSRTNPLVDAYKTQAKIVSVSRGQIVLDPRWKAPYDLEDGEWRIDEASSENLVQAMISNSHWFVKHGN